MRPYVIFECFEGGDRVALFELFTGAGYVLHGLPWSPSTAKRLDQATFEAQRATNFIAMPA